MKPTAIKKTARRAKDFFETEASGGIVLMIAALLALIAANSPVAGLYENYFNGTHLTHAINDGLMAIFFFLVGLEIKRELVVGALSSRAKAILPVVAAIGGMAVPALLYWWFNRASPATLGGWAIPSATDIAFALGVLAILGSRAPLSLKILLTAIAIIDDLGAILIIAFFYSHGISIPALLSALIPLAGLLYLNRIGRAHPLPYLILGAALWTAVFYSGIHATLAGVLTALFIPVKSADARESLAERMEHKLHPWVAYLILPLFGFANAGVSFQGISPESLSHPATIGIIAGLFLGKQIGIFAAIFGAVKAGIAPLPEGAGWRHIYALSALCGIGFTMSLFIGGLAFQGDEMQAAVRLGVLTGSVLSAGLAYIIFKTTPGGDK